MSLPLLLPDPIARILKPCGMIEYGRGHFHHGSAVSLRYFFVDEASSLERCTVMLRPKISILHLMCSATFGGGGMEGRGEQGRGRKGKAREGKAREGIGILQIGKYLSFRPPVITQGWKLLLDTFFSTLCFCRT